MKGFHHTFFNKDTKQFRYLKGIAEIIDQADLLKRPFCLLEDVSKSLLFDCQKCGDCALVDMAYLCPESQCPKFLRNGACGGSEKTWCEVRKDKPCVWVKIYDRLKSYKEESNLKEGCVPPRNWALKVSSN